MTPSTGRTERAARYFPFRTGPDADRIIRDAPDTDRDEQCRAVRLTSRHTRAMAAARPLWLPPPILIAVCIGTGFWWIAALGTVVCALACVILYGIARRARDDIRLLDGTVGIPIPDDLVNEVMTTGKAMHALAVLHQRAPIGGGLDEGLRHHRREIVTLNSRYTDHLHLARRYWVRGDMPRWRDSAERLPVIANEVSKLVDFIILFTAAND
ncbi:hypothetical protein [Nonomuraea sp. GTA35]|uniref:hypothetical protein n=1 Tax=Nonomuraea sp. GTA35 TaxID=1676746 RepID=UPI0035C075B9